MRSLPEAISESFIWGVGITRPRPGNERRAAIFITAMLLGSIAGVAGLLAFVLQRF